jgi:hypothetical protein
VPECWHSGALQATSVPAIESQSSIASEQPKIVLQQWPAPHALQPFMQSAVGQLVQ